MVLYVISTLDMSWHPYSACSIVHTSHEAGHYQYHKIIHRTRNLSLYAKASLPCSRVCRPIHVRSSTSRMLLVFTFANCMSPMPTRSPSMLPCVFSALYVWSMRFLLPRIKASLPLMDWRATCLPRAPAILPVMWRTSIYTDTFQHSCDQCQCPVFVRHARRICSARALRPAVRARSHCSREAVSPARTLRCCSRTLLICGSQGNCMQWERCAVRPLIRQCHVPWVPRLIRDEQRPPRPYVPPHPVLSKMLTHK